MARATCSVALYGAVLALLSTFVGCGGEPSPGPSALDGVLQTVQEAGIGCDAVVAPYKPEQTEIDLGVDIVEGFECLVNGSEVTGISFGSHAEAASALERMRSIACANGIGEFPYVNGGAWLISAVRSDGAPTTDDALTEKVAVAVGEKVSRMECHEGGGSGG